jgi:hypothetical protein
VSPSPITGTLPAAERVEHLGEGDEAGVRKAEPRGRDGKAAHERDLEPGLRGKLGRERVVASRHDLDVRLGQDFAKALSRCHGRFLNAQK